VLGALFLVLQLGMTRAFSRWYALGYSGMVVVSVMIIVIGHSALWNRIAGAILQ